MTWLIGIITFICSVVGFFTTGVFILSCVASVINPQIKFEDGEVVDRYQNSRLIYLMIASIAWGIVIAL